MSQVASDEVLHSLRDFSIMAMVPSRIYFDAGQALFGYDTDGTARARVLEWLNQDAGKAAIARIAVLRNGR